MVWPLKCPEDLGMYNDHLFTWSEDRTKWATGSGVTMFVNHSDTPNTDKVRDMVNNTMKLVALEDIPAHTELTASYHSKKWRDCF